MPGVGRAEIYFITAMMLLIMILSIAACYFFVKTYKKEMRENQLRKEQAKNKKLEAKKVEVPEV